MSELFQNKKVSKDELLEYFFHPYENIHETYDWMKWIEDAGLQVFGVFDRYAELSDIENPLLVPPDAKTLQKRINLGFMKGSLEFYLCASDLQKRKHLKKKRKVKSTFRMRKAWHLPDFWLQNPYLSSTSKQNLYRVWLQHLRSNYSREPVGLGWMGNLESYSVNEMKSFARYGMILPSMIQDNPSLLNFLYDPIESHQKLSREHQVIDFFDTALGFKVERELRKRDIYDTKRFYVVMERFVQSQF